MYGVVDILGLCRPLVECIVAQDSRKTWSKPLGPNVEIQLNYALGGTFQVVDERPFVGVGGNSPSRGEGVSHESYEQS